MERGVNFDTVAAILWSLFSIIVTVISHSGQARAADVCNFEHGATTMVAYCEGGCCDSYCCSASLSGVDSVLIVIILGIVAGIVVVALIIIAVVCCLKGRGKGKIKHLNPAKRNITETSDISARPKLYRENAMFIIKDLVDRTPLPSDRRNTYIIDKSQTDCGVRKTPLNNTTTAILSDLRFPRPSAEPQ